MRVRDSWDGPLLVKGVLDAEEAASVADCGADGIIVSNHGGRILDHAVPSITALPSIVEAVGSRVDVLLDSGVRRGADVVKALALGAKAVMVGRAPIWGAAVAGEEGAHHVLAILTEEITRVMMQIGRVRLEDIKEDCLWNRCQEWKS
jgi:isopentenyl diphosphate isomerase/L-lactate dehydrogenase-like FMN-dependent dehydrogenase